MAVYVYSECATGIWKLGPCQYQQWQQKEEGGGGKKKLQHISGIFQLMMCGCGSTGEREPLTVLSLFHSPRAPCCIPVHCTYFGNICSAPFFLFYCIVCALLLHVPLRAAQLGSLLLKRGLWNHLFPFLSCFLAWNGCIVGNWSRPLCRTREGGKVREE